MSEARHTPGPWVAHECHGTFYVFGGRDGQAMVADGETEEAWLARIRGVGRGATIEEQAANAHVMAAAPDLLAAAKSAQCSCSVAERDSGHLVGCWMPDLVAAIARAEGRPS